LEETTFSNSKLVLNLIAKNDFQAILYSLWIK